MGCNDESSATLNSGGANAAHSQPMAVTADERHDMIAVAAYFRAERRGFALGDAVKDWWEAAAEIDSMLKNMVSAGVTRGNYQSVGLRNALRFWAK